MKYEEAVARLEKRGIFPESAPDLKRMREGVARLRTAIWPAFKKYLDDPMRVIVVAGTNGKGSVCATLESFFESAGERTGFYSSPHLVDYTERIRAGGRDISRDFFARAYEIVSALTQDLPLTHFEVLTLMALWIFAGGSGEQEPVDRMILEVGLGGIWDATNAVPHGCAVVTSLSLDHTNLLGPTLSDIARNKLGIVPEKGIVVHQKFPEEVADVVAKAKNQTDCRWIETEKFWFDGEPGHPPRFTITTRWGRGELMLPGRRGAENTALAMTVFAALGGDPAKHLKASSRVRWPGRMEFMGRTKNGAPLYASGDHNPAGAESFKELLKYYPHKTLWLVAGFGKDKDREKILEIFFSLPETRVVLTETTFRGAPLESYGAWLTKAAGAFKSPHRAIEFASTQASGDDMVVVTGSLYLVGEIKKHETGSV